EVKPPPPPPPSIEEKKAPPPLAAGESQLPMLSRADVAVAEKKKIIESIGGPFGDLTALIALVQPVEQRTALCTEYRSRVYPSGLRVEAVDSFGDPVPATVSLDGIALGPTPFAGTVPVCAGHLSVIDSLGKATRDE